MTELPISSDVINVESCNKDFLEALEKLFHLAYTFDLIKVQRLCNLTFDKVLTNFFYKDLEPTCVFILQVLVWD